MTVGDIYSTMDRLYPFERACDFDNCGLLVGSLSAKVTTAAVMLDCTLKGIEQALSVGAQLIITHHPVLFHPIKSLSSDSVVYQLAKNGLSVISAHTNLDAAKDGVNECLCRALGFDSFETFYCSDGWEGRLCHFDTAKTPEEVANIAKMALNVTVKYTGSTPIKTLAVFSGNASGYLEDAIKAGADGFLCGDVKHDVFVSAENFGIPVFDAGHFHTEVVVVKPLCEALSKEIPEVRFIPVINDMIKFV